jgi:hypothetical protein
MGGARCEKCSQVCCWEVVEEGRLVRKMSVRGYVVTVPELIAECAAVKGSVTVQEMNDRMVKKYNKRWNVPFVTEDPWTV